MEEPEGAISDEQGDLIAESKNWLERHFALLIEDVEKIAEECNVSHDDVQRIMHMRKCSQHKRRSALIPKIGLRTPGLDWRSPVQEG